jgi:hypothetical protein
MGTPLGFTRSRSGPLVGATSKDTGPTELRRVEHLIQIDQNTTIRLRNAGELQRLAEGDARV